MLGICEFLVLSLQASINLKLFNYKKFIKNRIIHLGDLNSSWIISKNVFLYYRIKLSVVYLKII